MTRSSEPHEGVSSGSLGTQEAKLDHRDVFLKGEHVVLRALTEADVLGSNWYGWFNDEEITAQMQKHYFPLTQTEQLDFYRKEIVGNPRKLQLGICDAAGGPIVGVVSLNNIDHLNQKAEISIIIGEPRTGKVAFVIEAFQLMFRHAFRTLNLRRVCAGSLNDDLISFMCRALGYTREGTLRKDVFKHGEFRDVHLCGILREEYEASHAERARLKDSQ